MSIEWAQSILQSIARIPTGQVAGLFALFGFGQILCPPFPGDILLFFGGGIWPGDFFADFTPILLSYWVGTTLGSIGAYELGLRFGTHIFSWRWVRSFFPEHAQHAVTRWLNTSGAITLFAAKFVTGMNVPMLIISGAMGYERRRCYPVIIVTTIAHNCLFYGLGTMLGNNWSQVASLFSKYQYAFALVLVVMIALVVMVPKLLAKMVQRQGGDIESK